MLSVLLVNPPLIVPERAPRVSLPPLGLAYIASSVQAAGYDVRILDCLAEGSMKEIMVEPGWFQVGLTFEEIEMRLNMEPSAVVGIQVETPDQLTAAAMVAAAAKKLRVTRFIDIVVVAVGPGAAAAPDLVMADSNFDFAVLGEGEQTFSRLCEAIYERDPLDSIPGLVRRNNWGELLTNSELALVEDLDSLPPPARGILNMQRYLFGPSLFGEPMTPHTTLLMLRGCPSQCVHCPIPRQLGSKLRKRSVESIVRELESLVEEYAIREVELLGDNLFHDRAWAKEWMEAFMEMPTKLHWSPLNGLSMENLDREMAALAVQSGLRSVMLDIGAGTPHAFSGHHRRPGRFEAIPDVVSFLRSKGVRVGGTFVVGVPGETLEDMKQTVAFATSLGLHQIVFNVYTPSPGTPGWDTCIEEKYFTKVPDVLDLMRDRGYVTTDEFSADQALWQRDWARTTLEMRKLALNPFRLATEVGKAGLQVIFHPIGAARRAWRFLSLVGGQPLPLPDPIKVPGAAARPASKPEGDIDEEF